MEESMRKIVPVSLLALLLVASAAFAGEGKHKKAETRTVQGEIVDLGCYLGHGARGAEHKGCALKCIANGMPMGILTEDGELYLLTMSHKDADPFAAAKELAAQTVQITGKLIEKNGMKAIEVLAVKEVGTGS